MHVHDSVKDTQRVVCVSDMPLGPFEKEINNDGRGEHLSVGYRHCHRTHPLAEEVEVVRVAYLLSLEKLEDELLFEKTSTKMWKISRYLRLITL
jgi:hypothetical protein